MLRQDLKAAGIAYRDDNGEVVDIHSLRYCCATRLAEAGVHPSLAQEIMRHSTISLTMDRYTKKAQEAVTLALTALPAL